MTLVNTHKQRYQNSAQGEDALKPQRKQQGFSLIELMIVLAILAILTTVAAPNLSTFILNNRINNPVNELDLALKLARSKAIATGNRVFICPKVADANNACSDNRDDWNNGLLIYSKPIAMLNPAATVYDEANGDNLIKTVGLDFQGSIATANNLPAIITFQNNGFLAPANNGTAFIICDDRGDDNGYGVSISVVGKTRKNKITDMAQSCP